MESSPKIEYCLSNQYTWVHKILYTYFDDKIAGKKRIQEAFFGNKFEWTTNQILSLFEDSWCAFHYGIDTKTNRSKFYVSLYNADFAFCLSKIVEIKKILWLEAKYFLEKNFSKFDCLWFDIKNDTIELKIYELVKKEDLFPFFPEYLDKTIIKECGYLKTFSGRKKMFFRFSTPQKIEYFDHEFDTTKLPEKSEKLVKYYCVDWETKEIYFI
jgi:hypothetical protein